MKLDLDVDEIERLYVEKKWSMSRIASRMDVSTCTIRNRLEEAGVDRRHGKRWSYTDEKYDDEIRSVAGDIGRPPTSGEFDERSELSASGACARFGSWENAIRVAGLDPDDMEGSIETTDAEPVWRDRGWLEDRIEEGMSAQQIAEAGGCSYSNSMYWLEKQGLKERAKANSDGNTMPQAGEERLWQDEEWMRDRLEAGLSKREMAEEAGCAPGTITNWMYNHGLRQGDGRAGLTGTPGLLARMSPEDLGLSPVGDR